jgi:glycosyltransferase involved in cell wall biosynthesis
VRIGFACLWAPRPEATWSHTPWHLRAAMRAHADIVDVGVALPASAQAALKGLHVRWQNGRPITVWKQSPITDALCTTQVRRRAARASCDAVLQMQDLAVLDRPYFLYQDMSFDALVEMREQAGVPLYRGMSAAALRRRQERQRTVYERAAGVLVMSRWLARSLVGRTGVPAEKVHVVHPGTSSVAATGHRVPVRDRPRRRLLFIGREYTIKGGDLAVAALAVLRREVDPQITLTVVGPAAWPGSGAPPDGVEFLGEQPFAEVVRLYDSHDLFVMPSRLEGFGIALAEAGARGLPCVARDAYAMPEIVRPGVNGALITGDDPAELAKVIAGVLADDALYESCRARAAQTAAYFSWDRAGREALAAIRRGVGGR